MLSASSRQARRSSTIHRQGLKPSGCCPPKRTTRNLISMGAGTCRKTRRTTSLRDAHRRDANGHATMESALLDFPAPTTLPKRRPTRRTVPRHHRKVPCPDRRREHRAAPRGFRFEPGPVMAVVRPGSLVEPWRPLQLCATADKIVIMQAVNIGLTDGSTPNGNDSPCLYW